MAAPSDREVERLIPAVGVNNLARETALRPNAAREAVNVDFSEAGGVSRRQGRQKVIAGDLVHSLWRDSEFPYALYADGDSLYAFDRGLQRQFVLDGLAPGMPLSYARVNDAVYWTNGLQAGLVTSGLEALSWGPYDAPGQPAVTASTSGGLPAGRYQVAVTYRDAVGREGGTGEAVAVDVPAGGGIRLENIHVPPPSAFVTTLRVYRTGADDSSLRHVADVPTGITSHLIGEGPRGKVLDTQFLRALPPGQIVQFGHGRQWVARGNELLWSPALRFGVFDAATNRLRFPDAIDVVAPVGGGGDGAGVLVASGERTYWLDGADPAQFRQRILHPAGAVRGSAVADIPASVFGIESPQRCVVWLSRQGFFCVVLPGGQLVRVNESAASIDVSERASSVFFEADGVRRVITTLDAPTTYGLRVRDTAVARTIGPEQ